MSASLRVLTYHRVMDPRAARGCDPSLISATPEAFDLQMRHVAAHYRAVSADDVAAAWAGGPPLPPRAVLITFDDATRDFADVAWPIMRRWKLPATVFVPTAYPGRRDRVFWWDRVYQAVATSSRGGITVPSLGRLRIESPASRARAVKDIKALIKRLPHDEAMEAVERICREAGEQGQPEGDVVCWNTLRRLAREGVWIGAHTHTHPALTRVSGKDASDEIERSRDLVVEHTGYVPRAFAYPYGDHDDRVVEHARAAGFGFAVTCVDGHSVVGDDPLRLRRTNITRRTSAAIFAFRLTRAGAWLDRWRHRDKHRPTHRRQVPAARTAVSVFGSPGGRADARVQGR